MNKYEIRTSVFVGIEHGKMISYNEGHRHGDRVECDDLETADALVQAIYKNTLALMVYPHGDILKDHSDVHRQDGVYVAVFNGKKEEVSLPRELHRLELKDRTIVINVRTVEHVGDVTTVYTHASAATILDLFEDLLEKNNITIPSPEDDDKEEDNYARLYGSVYDNLLDEVEDVLLNVANAAAAGAEIRPYVYND